MAIQRDSGGGRKLVVKPKPKKAVVRVPKPEVAKTTPKRVKPQPKMVMPKPEATRPVTPKQRQAIERNRKLVSAEYNAKKYAAEAKKDKPTYLERQAAGVPIPKSVEKALTTSSGTAMKVLDKTTIPLHAVAGAAYGAEGRGFKGLTPRQLVKGAKTGIKQRTTYSDVLSKAGVKNKVVKYGAGLTGDVLLDPTTYVTFGAAAPAKIAAQKVAERTALKVGAQQAKTAVRATVEQGVRKGAIRKGETEAQAQARIAAEREATAKRLAARKAARVHAETPQNKGVTVGVGKYRTSGKTTSAISRTFGVSQTARNVREGRKLVSGEEKVRRKGEGPLTEDVVSSVSPGYRKTGVPEEAHRKVRLAEAEKRSAIANQERRLTHLAKGFEKQHSAEDYAQIIDAIESGAVGALKKDAPHLHAAAVRLRSEFRHMDRLDRQAGIRASSRKNYVYHLNEQKAATEAPRAARPARGGGSAKRRTIDKRIADLREAHPDLFSENVPKILAKRGPQTIRGVADVKLMRTLTSTGRRYAGDVREGEAVYHVPAKSSVPKPLSGEEMQALEKGKRQSGQYVVLNEKLAEDTLRNAKAQELTGLRRRYRRAHGAVKTILTMPMPSYHLRNAQGDISNASYNLNAKELGSALKASNTARRVGNQLRKQESSLVPGAEQKFVSGKTIKIGEEQVPVEQLIREAQHHGAIGSGFSRELRAMAGEGEHGRESRLRNLGQGREDWTRLGTYIGARRQGLDASEAAARVRETHFDYADLTPTERGLRDVLPFYTWAARNTPFQAKTLLKRPGKISRYEKAIEEGSKASGIPPEDLHNHLREYERLGLGIPAFGLRVAGMPIQLLPGNPATDLNRLTLNPTEQAKQIASMVTIYKAVPEALFNYSTFFRGAIDQGQKIPAPDWIGKVPLPKGIKKTLGLEYIYDARYKRKVWKWNPKADYLLKQLPETSFALGITTSAKNRRGQDTAMKLASLSGVRPQPIDKVAADLERAHDKQTQVGNRIKQLNKAYVTMDRIKNGTVPKQAVALIPEYERLNAQRNALGETIYHLMLIRLKRGEAVVLPRSGKPKVLTPAEQARKLLYGTGGDAEAKKAHDLLYGKAGGAEAKKAHAVLYGS